MAEASNNHGDSLWFGTARYTDKWKPEEDGRVARVRDVDYTPGPYQRGFLLGSGGWGNVYKVLRVKDMKTFAGKAVKSAVAVKKLREEGEILKSLNHDHLLKYIDWYEDTSNPLGSLLVTELCADGSLKEKIDMRPYGFERREILTAVVQLSEALAYLHEKNLFHCDVKPRNILIRTWDPVNVVLADCADIKSRSARNKPGGTESYWSPQLAKSRQRVDGKSDDVWALGVAMLGMMAQWPKMKFTERGLKGYPVACYGHAREMKRLNPGHEVVDLLCCMLTISPSERALARDCADMARKGLMEQGTRMSAAVSERNPLGLVRVEGFEAISFW